MNQLELKSTVAQQTEPFADVADGIQVATNPTQTEYVRFSGTVRLVADISVTDREPVVKAQLTSPLKQQSFEVRTTETDLLQLALVFIAAEPLYSNEPRLHRHRQSI